MKSLKTYAPRLAKMLGTTPAVLYERQRALISAGLLKEVPGRGPGSGVRFTTETVATLLIAYLGAGELRDVSTHVRRLLHLKYQPKTVAPYVPFSPGTTLLKALIAVLSDPKRQLDATGVAVSRTHTSVSASICGHPKIDVSGFADNTAAATPEVMEGLFREAHGKLWSAEFGIPQRKNVGSLIEAHLFPFALQNISMDLFEETAKVGTPEQERDQ